MGTKAELIFNTLKAEITSGKLPKGSRLLQVEIAERFETSTTPAREALRQLLTAGLVVGSSHHGVSVTAPDSDQIRSTYVMLRLLEPYAALRASNRMSRVDFAAVRRINTDYGDACARGDEEAARQLDQEFHFGIYGHCGLATLTREIQRFWDAFPWGVQGRAEAAKEHDGILDAMIAGDESEILSRMEDHVRAEFETLLTHLGHGLDSDPLLLEAD
ncbi:GntR family transcriptional regulator [Mycobacterium sp. ACS4331]|uniref:GntR family transcriptional regulator n=1 Tax=Mycobacterium sp. ACS4331 TaxID=1834121 RepID=UPI0008007653|nr:GntR family transcriptional regulator [Mycobacterium sp. ACS4331]OBF25035.1 hypothetical protein A5727_05695 [Mycobacterium sp. ACS4331]